MGRVRVLEAEDIAVAMRETFTDRPVEYEEECPFSWPATMRHVGDSLGVAYSSDKWQAKDARGRRDREDYLHIAESTNRLFVAAGHEIARGGRARTPGPEVSFTDVPMPRHFAILGLFKELRARLHIGGPDHDPILGGDGDGLYRLQVRHGMLGASKFLWSQTSQAERARAGHRRRYRDQPFLFVYTRSAGVLMIIVGDELNVEKDGIVG